MARGKDPLVAALDLVAKSGALRAFWNAPIQSLIAAAKLPAQSRQRLEQIVLGSRAATLSQLLQKLAGGYRGELGARRIWSASWTR